MLKYFCDVCGVELTLKDAKIKISTSTLIYTALPNTFVEEEYDSHADLWLHLCSEHKEEFLDRLVDLIKTHKNVKRRKNEE